MKNVQNDKSIKTIQMTSPLVLNFKDHLIKYGFVVNEIVDPEVLQEIWAELPKNLQGKPIGEATMSRDEFLNSEILKRRAGI
jgi:hypothetical protein